mgnify:CR=1 FL=1
MFIISCAPPFRNSWIRHWYVHSVYKREGCLYKQVSDALLRVSPNNEYMSQLSSQRYSNICSLRHRITQPYASSHHTAVRVIASHSRTRHRITQPYASSHHTAVRVIASHSRTLHRITQPSVTASHSRTRHRITQPYASSHHTAVRVIASHSRASTHHTAVRVIASHSRTHHRKYTKN